MGVLDWVTGVIVGQDAYDKAKKTAAEHGDTTGGYWFGIHSWGDITSIPSKMWQNLTGSLSDGISSAGGNFDNGKTTSSKKPSSSGVENYLQQMKNAVMQQKINHSQSYVQNKSQEQNNAPGNVLDSLGIDGNNNLLKYGLIAIVILFIIR